MGPYKSLRDWVDEFPSPMGNVMGVVDRPDRTFATGVLGGIFFGAEHLCVCFSPQRFQRKDVWLMFFIVEN